MCTVCGCGAHQTVTNEDADNKHPGQAPAVGFVIQTADAVTHSHAHAPLRQGVRRVQVEQDILGLNKQYADKNRAEFAQRQLFVLNLVSSPGSGKTSLLTETLKQLTSQHNLAVIEGDQQTAHDAERIRQTGVPAVQVNTGKGCHLDAHMIGHALQQLPALQDGMLFIENVGNLVCPAGFDLGERHKVVILSVTEGEDKPLKYPDMFHAADLMILNKTDLLPYVDFDVQRCIEYARRIHPEIEVLQLSARTGEGMEQWIDWLLKNQKGVAGIENANSGRGASHV